MKKISVFLLLLTVLLVTGCSGNHTHEYSDDWSSNETEHWHQAVCEHKEEISEMATHAWDNGVITVNPTEDAVGEKTYTCTVCGYSRTEEVEKLEHNHTWVNADCDTPKTCSVCQATEGEALGHNWVNADCDTPKTCSVCQATEGEALGHSWVNADCDTPKTCSVCQETEGEALGHSYGTMLVKDETGHWYECSCGNKKDFAEHTSSGQATEEHAEVCVICEYVINQALSHTHNYNQKIENESTLKSAATCVDNATYWYSCSCNAISNVLSYEKENSKKGHSYSVEYVWSENNLTVKGIATCENDSTHVLTEEVNTSYEVVTPSTTTVKGLGKYTATFGNINFENQIKEVELDLIPTRTYYLSPGVWAENEATFGVRAYNSTGAEEIFKPLTKGESGLYEFTCSVELTHVGIFRYDSTGNTWWNGVDYMEIPENKNMFVVMNWDSYLWDEYLTIDNASEFVEGSTLYLQLNGDWGSAMSTSGFAVQFEGFNGQSDILAMELVDSTNGIYKIVVPASGYIRVRFAQVNPSNVYETWNVSDFTYCDHDSTTNLIKLQNGWNSMVGNWTVYTE